MRLVRELLAADAEPEMARADPTARARRFLDVVTGRLGMRAGALVLRNQETGQLDCAATTIPERASGLLVERGGRTVSLLHRAAEERRGFLARRGGDEPLLQALHASDSGIEAVAILPLVDRNPVGVVVLAGDETALAAETIRTLTPTLRLLALLVSPARDGVQPDRALQRELDAARAESARQAAEVERLQARVIELEARAAGGPAGRMVAAAASTAQQAAELVEASAAAAPSGPPLVVVIDAARTWEKYAVSGHAIAVMAPAGDVATQVHALAPAHVVVNLVSPGALEIVHALESGARARVWGVLADMTNERVIGLGPLDVVLRPPTPESLVAAVERHAPRGARVFAAGRDADTLMKMRQALAKLGFSVSMARDGKQIDELFEMVKPHLVVVDLGLGGRAGYELVARAAGMSPAPTLIVVPADGDAVAALVDKLGERLASGRGMGAKQWLTELVTRKVKPLPSRPKPASATDAATSG